MHKNALRKAIVTTAVLAGVTTAATFTPAIAGANVDSGRYTLHSTGAFPGVTPVQVRGDVITYLTPGKPQFRLHRTPHGGFYDQGLTRTTFRKTSSGSYIVKAYTLGFLSGTGRMTRK